MRCGPKSAREQARKSALAFLPEEARNRTRTGAAPFGRALQRVSARYSSLSNASKRSSTELPTQVPESNAMAAFVDLPSAGRWHVVDVPMPGKIRAAVSIAQPVTRTQAFGRPRR
jgi:hypothetical protein